VGPYCHRWLCRQYVVFFSRIHAVS
jgi:hypothetical protein